MVVAVEAAQADNAVARPAVARTPAQCVAGIGRVGYQPASHKDADDMVDLARLGAVGADFDPLAHERVFYLPRHTALTAQNKL